MSEFSGHDVKDRGWIMS